MSETTTDAATTDAPQDGDGGFEGDFDPDRAKKLIERLRGENKTLKAKAAEAAPKLVKYDELVSQKDADLERWQSFGKQNEQRAEQAEREALRLRVALDKGLPKNLAARLQGDDEAALSADADELLALVPKDSTPRAPRPDASQGSSARPPSAMAPRDEFAAFLQNVTGR